MDLLLHNIGYVLSAVLAVILGVVVFIRGWKRPVNILYFLNNVSVTTFIVFYLLAINTTDPFISRHYLTFTLVNLFTVCLTAHLTFVTFNKAREQFWGIISFYTAAVALLIFFLSDISRYVLLSKPILFLPSFYNPGTFYWLFTFFFLLVAGYFFSFLTRIYTKTDDRLTKARIKYFALSFGWGYGVGSLGFLPVFGIDVISPIIPSLLGLYTIPLAYGALKYDLIELGVVAKNAALYTLTTALVGIAIIAVNFANNYFTSTYSLFPFWLVPLLSGFVVVAVGIYIWHRIRDVDILKYEFINNISHKFRTPLTHIRWLAEQLRTVNDPAERDRHVEQIQYASMRLFELTNIVIDVARDDNDLYTYKLEEVHLQDILEDLLNGHQAQIVHRKQRVSLDIGDDVPAIKADKARMQFAIQILFENALIYTPDGGAIVVSLKKVDNEVIFSIKDTGIGIDQKEIPRLFVKFYRTANARHADTEGMGIGLFMSKNIIEKHHGRIWAESEGEGHGSTFSFALPIKST
ncbi:MAG: HAMP domain-containing sensor histidine kinase [Patescibacteria group bacterium]